MASVSRIVCCTRESIIEFVSDRLSCPPRRCKPIDLEVEDRASLRAISVFNAYVLAGRVHAHTLYSKRLAAGTDIQHGKVECVRAVEVDGLRAGVGRRVTRPAHTRCKKLVLTSLEATTHPLPRRY